MKYFTKQWYQDCQKESMLYCNKNTKTLAQQLRKQIQKVHNDYQNHYLQIEPYLHNDIKKINMHDCKITDSGFSKNDFYMLIDSSQGFCSVDKLIFTNAEILKKDINLDNVWWLYDEIYLNQNAYEMHILFDSKDCKLGEMVIIFDDIIVRETDNNPEIQEEDQIINIWRIE